MINPRKSTRNPRDKSTKIHDVVDVSNGMAIPGNPREIKSTQIHEIHATVPSIGDASIYLSIYLSIHLSIYLLMNFCCIYLLTYYSFAFIYLSWVT